MMMKKTCLLLSILGLFSSCIDPTLTIVNDLHVDPETRRVTVYAQTLLEGDILSPPQVDPGECTTAPNGANVCFHPNAVYLNRQGVELGSGDGSGAWWIKHSWILDGEGYFNCEARPQETYDDCADVEGIMLDDGITMKIATLDMVFYNTRKPILDTTPSTYEVVRYENDTEQFRLIFECSETQSAFDGQARPCPDENTDAVGADDIVLHDGYWTAEAKVSELTND